MVAASARPLDAITFDFWDTLVHAPEAAVTRGERRSRIVVALGAGGFDVDHDEVGRVLAVVRDTFDQHWAANRQFTGRDGTRVLLDALDLDVDDATRQRVYDAFVGTDLPWIPNLTPNVADTLRALKALGLRIGIICDVGLSPSTILRSYLEHHGVLDLFDHWSFSDEVGAYKPDPMIFAHALEGLGGIEPARAAHIGDLRRTDVVGSRAFGMVSVRYRGSNDDVHRPGEGDRSIPSAMTPTETDLHEADHVISDHARLLDVLGLR
jgi:putative hydrolase of the HAD superfamily